ncbi:sigma-54-dependent transcriptional regulator [Luteolibacter marinus]|uniref:sigma-54-dependent transcriptional regulator n=1 Tax=Luteolibacter marinus TaxID=2776705 RepID=UPI001D003E95|nr:sigma-54 dependent transcriptional regulator [Luteolibacter marinus]
MPAPPDAHPNLLIVDDDETIQRLLVLAAKDHGWTPAAADCGQGALEALDSRIEAVILDHGLPDIDGIRLLEQMRARHPELPVVMLTGLNDAETAVRALRAGAADYLTKPFELRRLFDLLRSTRKIPAPAVAAAGPQSDWMKSASPAITELIRRVRIAARLDSTILLTGESGTGKTFIAREIHRLSPRAAEPFVTVSCPALPRDLLESELFGHEKGAFTGAANTRVGRFEQAAKGTLLLDEIGDLPLELQPKLLNVLQDREFFRLGGSKSLRTDARVIAATNSSLAARVESGSFREDLYYRLNIIELSIPPLRDRLVDLPALTGALLGRIAARRGVAPWTLTPGALGAFQNYDWPGNIRQLENLLERATAFAEGQAISERDVLPFLAARAERGSPGAGSRPLTLHEVERDAFIATYRRSGGNKARTARELGISERSVYNLLARHGLK